MKKARAVRVKFMHTPVVGMNRNKKTRVTPSKHVMVEQEGGEPGRNLSM